jgi:hypothetical protein
VVVGGLDSGISLNMIGFSGLCLAAVLRDCMMQPNPDTENPSTTVGSRQIRAAAKNVGAISHGLGLSGGWFQVSLSGHEMTPGYEKLELLASWMKSLRKI